MLKKIEELEIGLRTRLKESFDAKLKEEMVAYKETINKELKERFDAYFREAHH